MKHFPYIERAKVSETAIKGRFMYLDRRGRTAASTDDDASDKPLGVYYYDNEVASTVSRGWVQYYGYNYSLPIYLEIASTVTRDTILTSTADNYGIPASRDGEVVTGYARAVSGGVADDFIHVLVQYNSLHTNHAFSSGFDYGHFK